MGTLSSMLGTFAFGRALAGLRDLGRGPSAFAGLGAPAGWSQWEVLDKAINKLLTDNAAQFRAFVGRFGAETDLLQDAMVYILRRARSDPKFAADPEAWVKKVITKQYVMKAIQNAWFSYARSQDAKAKKALAQQIQRNKEGEELESDVADPEAGVEVVHREVSRRRELPMLVKYLVEDESPKDAARIKDVVYFGMQAMTDAADRIARGQNPAEARLIAYNEAAERWNRKNKDAEPYAFRDAAGGTIKIDGARFQRDLLDYMKRMRKIAQGRGEVDVLPSGVFLSEGRSRGAIVGSEAVELPASRIPRDEAGRRMYIRPSVFFLDDKTTRGVDHAMSAEYKAERKAARQAAREAARAEKRIAAAAGKEARKAARAAVRAKREAAKEEALESKIAKLNEAKALLAKKRAELTREADAGKLTSEELERRRSVLNAMGEKLAAKSAKLVDRAVKSSRGGAASERQSQAVPSAPNFAEAIMAIRAVDAEEAAKKADDLSKKVEEVYAKADAGLKGVSAFAGLFGVKRKVRRARKASRRASSKRRSSRSKKVASRKHRKARKSAKRRSR